MAGNSVFRFKQFTIRQDRCAMKVTSDACLFGAWADVENASRILDIGTGTGLLALMIAQRQPAASIDAIEINAEAATQAAENIGSSPWNDRIMARNTSVQRFVSGLWDKERYDLVICNPPFYSFETKSVSKAKRMAWHSETLSLDELASSVKPILSPRGKLLLLLPCSERGRIEEICLEHRMFVTQSCLMKSFSNREPHRVMVAIERNQLPTQTSELVVYQSPQEYSRQSEDLLRPFFLKIPLTWRNKVYLAKN